MYFLSFAKRVKGIAKDIRLFKKILKTSIQLPYPGELKNMIKTSLAFSDQNNDYDHLRRLYNRLIGNLKHTTCDQLRTLGFTVTDIEKLKVESQSTTTHFT